MARYLVKEDLNLIKQGLEKIRDSIEAGIIIIGTIQVKMEEQEEKEKEEEEDRQLSIQQYDELAGASLSVMGNHSQEAKLLSANLSYGIMVKYDEKRKKLKAEREERKKNEHERVGKTD